jgi:hypothetical protein
METISIERSPTIAAAAQRFLEDLGSWGRDRMSIYAGVPAIDEHDQGTFLTGLEPYLLASRDAQLLAFIRAQRDLIRDHYVASGQWRHGYWKKQEAHHGTEHFELFLGFLARLDPHDSETRAQLIDAAEHLGNWVSDVPDWFDWRSGLFHSIFFGTEQVGGPHGAQVNVPDHLRCVNIALLAQRLSGEDRYLDLANAHGRLWAEAINSAARLPVGLWPLESGVEAIYDLEGERETQYRSFAGELPAGFELDLARAENYLASDGINCLLRLWQVSGQVQYRRAAERLLDVLVTSLHDPDAGSAADALRAYGRFTGDERYQAAVLSAADAALAEQPLSEVRTLSLEAGPKLKTRPVGIGKRSDMLAWFEDGRPRRHSPVLLALAAEIRQDENLATAALDLGRAYFNLARRVLPDGRSHGCAARTVSAVARGHGRENHAGVTTAVLLPLLKHFAII